MIASSCSRMVGVGRSTTATFSGETRTTAFIVFGRDMVKVDFERLTVDSEASRNVGMQEPVNNCGHTRTSRRSLSGRAGPKGGQFRIVWRVEF